MGLPVDHDLYTKSKDSNVKLIRLMNELKNDVNKVFDSFKLEILNEVEMVNKDSNANCFTSESMATCIEDCNTQINDLIEIAKNEMIKLASKETSKENVHNKRPNDENLNEINLAENKNSKIFLIEVTPASKETSKPTLASNSKLSFGSSSRPTSAPLLSSFVRPTSAQYLPRTPTVTSTTTTSTQNFTLTPALISQLISAATSKPASAPISVPSLKTSLASTLTPTFAQTSTPILVPTSEPTINPTLLQTLTKLEATDPSGLTFTPSFMSKLIKKVAEHSVPPKPRSYHLTDEQRLLIVKLFYSIDAPSNNSRQMKTCQILRQQHGLAVDRATVARLIKKFEMTKSVKKIPVTGKKRGKYKKRDKEPNEESDEEPNEGRSESNVRRGKCRNSNEKDSNQKNSKKDPKKKDPKEKLSKKKGFKKSDSKDKEQDIISIN